MSGLTNISPNDLLTLYYLSCDGKKNKNNCNLLSSVIFSQMYLNGSLPNNYMNIFNLHAIDKYLNNNDNKDTVNSLLNFAFLQSMINNQQLNTKLLKGGGNGNQKLVNYIGPIHDFISASLNQNNLSGGGKKVFEDMLVFGGAKKQRGGQTVCPSSLDGSDSLNTSEVQSYTSTDYSYNTYNSESVSKSDADTITQSLKSSQMGGRVMEGCLLGDTTMNCSNSVPSVESPMNLGEGLNSTSVASSSMSCSSDLRNSGSVQTLNNQLNMESLTQSGGESYLEGSSVSSTSTSNGRGLESQSVWNESQMTNNLSTQMGGISKLEGSEISATSMSNGRGMEGQSVWDDSQMNSNLSTQNGGAAKKYNVKMEFKKAPEGNKKKRGKKN